jgi:hypothetical protein
MFAPVCPCAGASGDESHTCLPDTAGFPRLVDHSLLVEALAALDAVIQCEPFADISPPGTEGFAVYELVAAARERVAQAIGVEV